MLYAYHSVDFILFDLNYKQAMQALYCAHHEIFVRENGQLFLNAIEPIAPDGSWDDIIDIQGIGTLEIGPIKHRTHTHTSIEVI